MSRYPMPTSSRSAVRRAGLWASLVALAWLWLASALVEGIAFVPAALADFVIRTVPGEISTFFIALLGGWAVRLLALGAVAGSALVGAEALWWSRARGDSGDPLDVRPLVAGALLAVSCAVVAGLGAQSIDVLATLLAFVVAALLYAATARSVYDSLVPADEGRRRILRIGAGGAFALALGGGVAGWLLRAVSGPDRNVRLVAAAMPEGLPEDGDFPELEGLPSEVTSADDHYVVDIDLITPSVEVDSWSLRIHGLVDNPLRFEFAELQRKFEVVEEHSVMTCISNEVGGDLVGNSAWGGVRLADVLRAARPRDQVVDVVMRASDGYSDSIPLDTALDPHVLLAVSQNGEPLLQEHGFPCRVRVPSIYGMKNVKWITEIELVDKDYLGYWMRRGWSDEAIVKTGSRIDVAGSDGRARVGEPTWVAGAAWAGDRGIDRVEVSVDNGSTWTEAMLKDPINQRCWRLWALRWTPERAGSIRVQCRATDGQGETQTERRTEPSPAGASGYPATQVQVEQ